MGSGKGSIVRSGWRLLLRPVSGNPPKRRQWLQLSTTNLQCLTPLTLSFSFSLYPSCSLSFSLSLITILHLPRRNACQNLTFTEPQTPAGSHSPFSLFTFSLRNPRPHFPPFLSSLSLSNWHLISVFFLFPLHVWTKIFVIKI